jgi:hypothetical protein
MRTRQNTGQRYPRAAHPRRREARRLSCEIASCSWILCGRIWIRSVRTVTSLWTWTCAQMQHRGVEPEGPRRSDLDRPCAASARPRRLLFPDRGHQRRAPRSWGHRTRSTRAPPPKSPAPRTTSQWYRRHRTAPRLRMLRLRRNPKTDDCVQTCPFELTWVEESGTGAAEPFGGGFHAVPCRLSSEVAGQLCLGGLAHELSKNCAYSVTWRSVGCGGKGQLHRAICRATTTVSVASPAY